MIIMIKGSILLYTGADISLLALSACPTPTLPPHGLSLEFTGLFEDDIATYSCDTGYEPLEGNVTTCTLVDEDVAIFVPQMMCLRKSAASI